LEVPVKGIFKGLLFKKDVFLDRINKEFISRAKFSIMSPSLRDKLKQWMSDFATAKRESVIALTCTEAMELENIFSLLLLGSFVGFPAPPTFIAVELLPYMEREMRILHQRAEDAGDMLAELCGILGID
jgi:hypothetical protein